MEGPKETPRSFLELQKDKKQEDILGVLDFYPQTAQFLKDNPQHKEAVTVLLKEAQKRDKLFPVVEFLKDNLGKAESVQEIIVRAFKEIVEMEVDPNNIFSSKN
ncbi:MAG TPA: hypothetical protein VJZ52_01215 [Candidatus Paceibacterota bacterium]|nr:hypothetical protein [Candidatus Paceibacterota bacterium]